MGGFFAWLGAGVVGEGGGGGRGISFSLKNISS